MRRVVSTLVTALLCMTLMSACDCRDHPDTVIWPNATAHESDNSNWKLMK